MWTSPTLTAAKTCSIASSLMQYISIRRPRLRRPRYDAFYAKAQTYGGLPTRAAIRILVQAAYQHNILSVIFMYFPDREGVVGANWNPGHEDAAQRAYIDKKLGEAEHFRPIVIRAVRNGL